MADPRHPRARPRFENASYRILRFTLNRLPFLRPSDTQVRQIAGYCVALSAERHKIKVHGVCYAPDHVDLVVTDPSATLPEFMKDANFLVARCVNAKLERKDYLWGAGTYDAQPLYKPLELVDHVAEVMALPAIDGWVRDPKDWEGFITRPKDVGQTFTFERPDVYFAEDSDLPEEVELTIEPVPGFEALSLESYRGLLKQKVREKVKEAQTDKGGEPRRFVGCQRARTLDLQTPVDGEEAVERRKRVRWWEWYHILNSGFPGPYVRARRRWMDDKKTKFPPGTYGLRVTARVEIEDGEERAVG